MNTTVLQDRRKACGIRDCIRAFRRDEGGSMFVLALVFFVLMVMVGGMAVDLMRFENARTKLQQTLDRSVLAAASLRQQRDPKVVVEEYFEAAGLADQLGDVDGFVDIGERLVYADGATVVPTFFMDMLNINSITAAVAGEAEESVGNVEISLVLDISGSMRYGDQIGKLRIAAKNFFKTVLEGPSASTTSINVVPYAGQVNAGPLFAKLGAVRTHTNSSCIELTEADYSVSGPPPAGRGQVPHFMNWAIDKVTMNWGWCPMDNSPILIAENDLTKLSTYITNIRLHDGTGTMTGTKYGVMLLDPAMKSTFAQLATEKVINDDFADRPGAWSTTVGADTAKYLIVMTDGNITDQYRPKYNSFVDLDGDKLDNEQWVTGKDKKGKDIYTADPDTIDGTDYPFWNATVELEKQPAINRNGVFSSRATNLTRFYSQCNLAKAKKVIVYTIAFNAGTSGQTEMRNCATAPELFYNVATNDAEELDNAFQSIARSIKQLRLTQ